MYVLNAKIFEHKNDILIPICVSTDYVLIKSLHDKLTHYFNEHIDSGSDERLEYILSAKEVKLAMRKNARDFWKENFDAEKLYSEFAKEISVINGQ